MGANEKLAAAFHPDASTLDHTDDPEAENALADIVQRNFTGWVPLTVRYRIAIESIRWLQTNRPQAAQPVAADIEHVNRLLYRYDHDEQFGVHEFAQALGVLLVGPGAAADSDSHWANGAARLLTPEAYARMSRADVARG